LILQLYIIHQRVSLFCAIFWICSFIDFKLNSLKIKKTTTHYCIIKIIDIFCEFVEYALRPQAQRERRLSVNVSIIFDL